MRRVFLGVLLLLAAIGLIVAGCGGGSSSSSSSEPSTSSGASSETAESSSTTAAAGGEEVDCSSVEKPTKLTWEGPTEPVTPPSGKHLAVLIPTALELEAAGRPVEGMEEAL